MIYMKGVGNLVLAKSPTLFLRVCKEGRENDENIAKNLYIFDEK